MSRNYSFTDQLLYASAGPMGLTLHNLNVDPDRKVPFITTARKGLYLLPSPIPLFCQGKLGQG